MSNILLIGRYGHPKDTGGVASATRNLTIASTDYGCSFDIFSIRDPLLINRELQDTASYENEKISLTLLGSPVGFEGRKNPDFESSTDTLAKRVLELSVGKKPDLVHVITTYPHYVRVGEKVSHNLNVPYVVSARGSDVYGHNPEYTYEPDKEWYHSPLRNASTIIALSDFQITELNQNFRDVGLGVPIKKVRNGVNTDFFRPLEKNISPGSIKAVYTGRIRKFKRIVDILMAVHHAKDLGVDIQLDLYGKKESDDFGAFQEIQEYITQHNLQDTIRCSGEYIPHRFLPEIYRRHNLFIHASICEGLPNSAMEAMSCGLAVMMNRSSGSDDLLVDKTLEFETGNISQMANLIKMLAKNQDTLTGQGENNREFAVKHHWDNIARQYIEVYDYVLNSVKQPN